MRDSAGHSTPSTGTGAAIRAGVVAGGLLGALLLLVAEFTTLFEVRAANISTPIKSVSTGSHHAFALVPVAVLAVALSYGVWRDGSRPALLALGLLGLISLLIALLGDLPDAQASGLIGTSSSHYATASSSPSAGLYMETLGAVVLLITCVSGFLMLGPPPGRRAREVPPTSRAAGA